MDRVFNALWQHEITPLYKSRFFTKINHSVFCIPTKGISHFIFEDNVTVLSTKENKNFVINYSLDALENLLDPIYFFRINRRCIININCIEQMNLLSRSRIEIVLESSLKERVSRSKNIRFKLWLDL